MGLRAAAEGAAAAGPAPGPWSEKRAADMPTGAQPTAERPPAEHAPRVALLYHFCRLQLPALAVPPTAVERHLPRTFGLYRTKAGPDATWHNYLESLYPLDWFIACACLDGNARAWEHLFAARAGR